MRKPRVEAAADFLNARGYCFKFIGGKWRETKDNGLAYVVLAVEIIKLAEREGWGLNDNGGVMV
jgi:hypothetical protein